MTDRELLELAQECQLIGMRPHLDGIYQESLERFATLVRAAALEEAKDEALLRQALEYLERSADNYPVGHGLSRTFHEQTIAAIRALKEKT